MIYRNFKSIIPNYHEIADTISQYRKLNLKKNIKEFDNCYLQKEEEWNIENEAIVSKKKVKLTKCKSNSWPL